MSDAKAITVQGLVPLCVDLDGTLLRTDLLWESLVRLLERRPLFLFLVPFWLLRGRAYLKARIAERVHLEMEALPFNEEFLKFLRGEKARGRPLYLVTASDTRLATAVGTHLGLFSTVIASDGQTNLRARAKAANLVERFGQGGFDYAGNSAADLPVWKSAGQALVVNPSLGVLARARRQGNVSQIFQNRASLVSKLVQVLRPHQWVKNLIIFVPLVTSHRLRELPLTGAALLAFISFSLCASAAYVLNDLLDLESDRHHARKRLRPFASGDLPLPWGLVAVPVLLAGSILIASRLSWNFAAVLGTYLALTLAYSGRLKQVPLVDVFCLAGLYTIRLLAGQEATGIICSYWLLLFSIFIFLSLALVKRFIELGSARRRKDDDIPGRGYFARDLELVSTLGPCSGYLSVLVLALYVNSQEVRVLYRHPTLLLLVCPLLLYWISRVWLIAHRGQMHDDPIVFALRDRVSYLVAVLALVVLWAATGH